MLTPFQLPSVYHNPSCDGCARDAEENRRRNTFTRTISRNQRLQTKTPEK